MELTNLTIMNALCDYRGICAKASMLTLLMQENTEERYRMLVGAAAGR